jgi:putative ubiquitin-RnfH superfamily antitoxin RatB of RatAB toxin-antitoxin module
MADLPAIRVVVVVSPGPRDVREASLSMAQGATVAQALHASGLPGLLGEPDPATLVIGVWRRKAALTQVLRDLDRVEVYRPLVVDPKVARRERFARQGARSAGLFANRRAGAKPGY